MTLPPGSAGRESGRNRTHEGGGCSAGSATGGRAAVATAAVVGVAGLVAAVAVPVVALVRGPAH